MEENQKDKKEYELGFLAKEEGTTAEIVELVRAHGGEIFTQGPVNKIPLAYPVKKEEQAFFGFLQFNLDPAKIKPLSEALNLKAGVLRSLLMTPPPMRGKKTRAVEEARAGGGDRPPFDRQRASSRPASARTGEAKPAALSNEALEKKIEEILQ